MNFGNEPIFQWLAQYAYQPTVVYISVCTMMIASAFGFPLPEEISIISVGILDASLVHPREVFEPAVRLNAGSIILAHNHPSGVLEPSPEDKTVTKRLKQSADILGIGIEDHVIITSKSFYSFKKDKML